jgi:regulator of cell morphogenesis and NO signaling
MLAAEAGEEQRTDVNPAAMTLTQLADHIEATHHAWLRQEFPRLTQMTEKVASVHGHSDQRLASVAAIFAALRAEMESHMFKEERILFPLIRQLEASGSAAHSHCGTIANPIRVMEMEHDSAGGAVGEMRTLTDGFTPPAGACNTYRAMLDTLRQLEADLHQHVHKENNVLFPRALELEASLAGR